MTSKNIPQLSKTKFTGGLQCLKRVHLECFSRELADPVPPGQQALFDTGTAVGELARQRFLDGRLIEAAYYEHPRAEAETQQALAAGSHPALYEAAFTFENIRTRVDILRSNATGNFDLIEVKSSTGLKPEHIPDVAIQLYVLDGCGIGVNSAYLMHIDNTYVFNGGEYELDRLFRLEDVTDLARTFLASTAPEVLVRMWEVLQNDTPPEIAVGPQCTQPYTCPFFGHCHKGEPDHEVRQLPRASKKLLDRLAESGIQDIRDIPAGFSDLSDRQQRVRDCVVSGEPYIGPGLAAGIAEIKAPVYFMDFETVAPALPLYIGTRPYQTIPFQWSLHVRDSSGQLRHEEYLHDSEIDPREAFLTSLLDGIGEDGTIVVYSNYEQTILKQLAAAFPEYKDSLLALCDRMFDLLKLVRQDYYHPRFHGSYSIKSVLPALVPQMSYDDLEIQEGANASASFIRMISPGTPEKEQMALRMALLAYCERDTEAMVEIYLALCL